MLRIYNNTIERIDMKLVSNLFGMLGMIFIIIMGMLYKEL